jgi:NOL1/NOP2/sun family putative RNA methylase
MNIPIEFLDRMRDLLGESEYKEFLDSFNKPRLYGLRINTLKISVEEFLKISPFKLEPIPWTKDGFYYQEGQSPGKHPYYHAGLYYIQEPSAMLPGVVLDARPGENILDLCAAPGGKAVQIAAGMKGQGLLVVNDINCDRVKGLVKNIELYGVKNALVTNETPSKLSENFRNYFDKILIDAPCSGEGMLRKDEEAAKGMKNFTTGKCTIMQWEILRNVDSMLKEGGSLIYSTCTFSPDEDEKMISHFLEEYSNYELVEITKSAGIENGRPEWSDGNKELLKTARLWPHKLNGEGHFVALLRKKTNCGTPNSALNKKDNNLASTELEAFRSFETENLNIKTQGYFYIKGSNIYNLPVPYPDLNGIKVAKFGWYLGDFIHGKFEPSHSIIISLNIEDIKNVFNLSIDGNMVNSFLKGETLMFEGEKGFVGICVNGFTLGWAKQTGSFVKNMYPKGWRKMN